MSVLTLPSYPVSLKPARNHRSRKRVPLTYSSLDHKTGEPVLRVNPATSRVAVPVRQTCLKSLYDAFVYISSFNVPLSHLRMSF